MKNEVIVRANQEVTSDDFMNIQDYARSSFDTLVDDAIVLGPSYAGFTITKTAATQVTLTAGRLYDATGAVWEQPVSTVIDFFSNLPLVTQKWCALTVNGVDVQQNVEPRDFLIDATTGQTQPQSVAMEDSRTAVINTVAGVEAPQPSYPSTPSTVVVIGYVLLSTTGIQQVIQYTPTMLPNLGSVAAGLASVQQWEATAGAQINSLATALTNLQNKAKGLATENELQALANLVANLSLLTGTVAAEVQLLAFLSTQTITVLFQEQINFVDTTGVDTTNSTVVISEGALFPATTSGTGTFALLNALDVNASVNSGFLLPTFSQTVRITCSGYSGQIGLSTFSYLSSVSYRRLSRRRRRQRCGRRYAPPGVMPFTKASAYDALAQNLAFTAESFGAITAGAAALAGNPAAVYSLQAIWRPTRLTQFWEDNLTTAYHDRVTTTFTASGQHVAQVFLNAQEGWLTQIGLFFTQAATTGNVTISICNLNKLGQPDVNNAIQTVTLSVGNILTGSLSSGAGLPTLVETTVAIPPTYLEAGLRYAIVIATAGAHYLAMTTTDAVNLQGNYFYADSTGNFNVDLTQNIRCNLYYAKWAQTRYEIPLQPLSLSGGIEAIDFLSEIQTPLSTTLEFHVQISGVWYPLGTTGVGPNLSGLPALLPLKAVFIGTTDVMPGHGLDGASQVNLLGLLATSCSFMTPTRTPSSSAANIHVRVVFANYDGGTHHTFTVRVKSGSNYTSVAASTGAARPDGTYEYNARFHPSSPLATYLVQVDMSTTLSGSVFQIAQLTHYGC